MRLDEILALPRSGVVILKKDMQVLISYTTSMGANLEALYNQFTGQSNITMEIVSAGADIETLKLHCEYYRDYYDTLGYKSLHPRHRKSIQYRVRCVPSKDFRCVDVELVTARGDGGEVVGKFKTKGEARKFIETYYGTDNPFRLPVYAVNADTKAFVLDTHKKLLDLI